MLRKYEETHMVVEAFASTLYSSTLTPNLSLASSKQGTEIFVYLLVTLLEGKMTYIFLTRIKETNNSFRHPIQKLLICWITYLPSQNCLLYSSDIAQIKYLQYLFSVI